MDFQTERFTDVDADGFCEYSDPMLGAPFLYASRNHGRYKDEDLAIYRAGDVRNMTQVYKRGPGDIGDFQIISAGRDGEYGRGGDYSKHHDWFSLDREAERDNLTNFSSGRLDRF